jgi:SAM-dependent methyltransferase
MPQEIIISDSGSSDGSENIVREEALRSQAKVTILPIKTPGMVANWNSTIRAASGKYIKFLFQDDLLHPDCLEQMVTLAESDERIGFVFSPRELLVEPSAKEDPLTKWLQRYHNLSAAFGELKTSQPGSLLLGSQKLLQEPFNKIGEPTAVLIRTRVLREAGSFSEGMCQLVDMEMWIRLMAISHVGYISKPLVSVRIHPGQASNRQTTEEIGRIELKRLCDTLRRPNIYPLLHRRIRRALRFAERRQNPVAASHERSIGRWLKDVIWSVLPTSFRLRLRFVNNYVGLRMGRLDPLLPPASLHWVGDGDFVEIGEEFFRYFVDRCELRPNDRVLDVGSGTGRMARPLTRYLKGGSYEGIDIVAPSVRWCQNTYTSRYPNFRFHFADIYNNGYNPAGKYKATEYRFPFASSSFDFVFLTSVFTHMLPQDMEHYLFEIVRVLKPAKRCLITYFLLNPASWKFIKEGVSHYSFQHELPGCRIESADAPEAVVAYDESSVRGLYAKYRLNITEPVLYGTWCKGDGLSWQDIVIASKPAEC